MERIKLLCIPHAGGSSITFWSWLKYIADNIDIIPIELAGRGMRSNETLCTDMEAAVQDVISFIERNIGDVPYAIFGHSMGSWIAFETALKIMTCNIKKPVHLYFSGNIAPHCEIIEENISHLPDDKFIKAILDLGNTPKEIFENYESRDLFLPILRADYKIIETYINRRRNLRFDCPVSILYGKRDKLPVKDIKQWSIYASEFEYVEMEGGHMYINENRKELIHYINKTLSNCKNDYRTRN